VVGFFHFGLSDFIVFKVPYSLGIQLRIIVGLSTAEQMH
jgi:hypothetical protein